MQTSQQKPQQIATSWKSDLDKMKVYDSVRLGMRHYNDVKNTLDEHFSSRNSKIFTTNIENERQFSIWRLK